VSELPTVIIHAVTGYSLGEKNNLGGRETIVHRAPVEAEVLTIHLEKRTMRVRYVLDDYGSERICTPTVSAEPFFQEYEIVPVQTARA